MMVVFEFMFETCNVRPSVAGTSVALIGMLNNGADYDQIHDWAIAFYG